MLNGFLLKSRMYHFLKKKINVWSTCRGSFRWLHIIQIEFWFVYQIICVKCLWYFVRWSITSLTETIQHHIYNYCILNKPSFTLKTTGDADRCLKLDCVRCIFHSWKTQSLCKKKKKKLNYKWKKKGLGSLNF